jgi:hypothetical protein
MAFKVGVNINKLPTHPSQLLNTFYTGSVQKPISHNAPRPGSPNAKFGAGSARGRPNVILIA